MTSQSGLEMDHVAKDQPGLSTAKTFVVPALSLLIAAAALFINYYQAKTNREAVELLQKQHKYAVLEPRLLIDRDSCRISKDTNAIVVNVRNVGQSPAFSVDVFLEITAGLASGTTYRDGEIKSRVFEVIFGSRCSKDYLEPQRCENVEVPVEIRTPAGFERATVDQKKAFFETLQIRILVFYADIEGEHYSAKTEMVLSSLYRRD